MSDIPMRYCDICHQPILAFHSWHADGHRLVHLTCEMNRTPATHESFRYEGDSNLMLNPKHIAHVADGRRSNVPPHLRTARVEDES